MHWCLFLVLLLICKHLKPWKPFYLIFFVCRCKIRINGLFGKNSRLRCFVANFLANGFTRFLCYFCWAKSALVLIFTLLECLETPHPCRKKIHEILFFVCILLCTQQNACMWVVNVLTKCFFGKVLLKRFFNWTETFSQNAFRMHLCCNTISRSPCCLLQENWKGMLYKPQNCPTRP